MQVGIIGAGNIGQAFARQLARAGIAGVIANSRGGEHLASLARDIGPGIAAGSLAEAAEPEMVLLAVPWRKVAEVLAGIPEWNGRILIDATNPIGPPDFRAAELGGRTSSAVVAGLVPDAQLVKAFNTLRPEVLAADPRAAGGRRVVFFSGDHWRAKREVGRLVERLGFAGIDLVIFYVGGGLQQFPGGPLAGLNLVRID